MNKNYLKSTCKRKHFFESFQEIKSNNLKGNGIADQNHNLRNANISMTILLSSLQCTNETMNTNRFVMNRGRNFTKEVTVAITNVKHEKIVVGRRLIDSKAMDQTPKPIRLLANRQGSSKLLDRFATLQEMKHRCKVYALTLSKRSIYKWKLTLEVLAQGEKASNQKARFEISQRCFE